VTGVDLVREMLRVAAGEALPFTQEQIVRQGTALECRICAEDPRRQFTPSTGDITDLAEPSGPFVRVDSGVCRGQRVSTYYDSLLAKVCVWAPNRPALLERMRRATREFGIAGLVTNLEFHETLLSHPRFVAGDYDTGFVDQNPQLLGARPASDEELAAFLVASHLARADAARPEPRTPSRWVASFRP